ncbi:MAG: DUF1759 domain-containing protein, partial [Clostridium sp.]
MSVVELANVIKEEAEISKQSLEGELMIIEADAVAAQAAALQRKAEAMRKHGQGTVERCQMMARLVQGADLHSDCEEDDVVSMASMPRIERQANQGRSERMNSYIDDCRRSQRPETNVPQRALDGRERREMENSCIDECRRSQRQEPTVPQRAVYGQERREMPNGYMDNRSMPQRAERSVPHMVSVGPEGRGPPEGPKFIRTELPRLELPKFDGEISEYWNFKKQFEIYIEGRTDDNEQRMLYLLNHCTGKAKRAIKCYANMPASEGYPEAKATLQQMYGRPHVISRTMIDRLLRFPEIRKYDETALSDLLLSMSECYVTLKQMNYMADLDAIATLQRIVDKLPEDMVDRWIIASGQINDMGREARFEDLKQFVAKEASLAGNRFAERR